MKVTSPKQTRYQDVSQQQSDTTSVNICVGFDSQLGVNKANCELTLKPTLKLTSLKYGNKDYRSHDSFEYVCNVILAEQEGAVVLTLN